MLVTRRAVRPLNKLPGHCADLRRFSQNRQRGLSSPRSFSSPRPQLPFLSYSQSSSPLVVARLLSTEQKKNLKGAVKDIAKWTTIIWTFAGLLAMAKFGLDLEISERQRPTPPDWTSVSRYKLQRAQSFEHPPSGEIVSWGDVGDHYQSLLARLEDLNGEGAGIQPPLGKGEDILVEGIGKTGYDISAKSEPWRRGYHQALMGAARAAEHLENQVRDTTRNLTFPRDTVKGPSNPHPKHVGHGSPEAPREEDCEPAFEKPHVYYMKIITTHGFSSRQRLDAALSYAEYLRFKGLYDSAEDMYNWAFDIALNGHDPATPSPVDKSTGILSPDTTGITQNILLTASSLGVHYAQTGKLQAALPIFISVLRAQQNLPPALSSDPGPAPLPTDFIGILSTLFSAQHYPPAPPSGDEPATATPATACASSGTMLHIGEVLYASAGSPSEEAYEPSSTHRIGISWTRQAIDNAESQLKGVIVASQPKEQQGPLAVLASPEADPEDADTISVDPSSLSEAKKRCSECLLAGLDNWKTMLEPFSVASQRHKAASPTHGEKSVGRAAQDENRGWLPWNSGGERNGVKENQILGANGHEIREYPSILEAQEQHNHALEIRRFLRKHGLNK